jgi:hypothetical protein
LMEAAKGKRSIRGLLAAAFLSLWGGGCFVLGYDFDKLPVTSCATNADCPGDGTECGERACVEERCAYVRGPGTPVGQQVDFDCKRVVCDGNGKVITQSSGDEDAPTDGDTCTEDKCADGLAIHPLAAEGAPCGKGLAFACNSNGVCQGCAVDDDCDAPGPCVSYSCQGGVCIKAAAPAGFIAADIVVGDCYDTICGEGGEVRQVASTSDRRDDMDPCTTDLCEDGAPKYDWAPDGTPCGDADCQSCTAGKCGECSPGYGCEGTTCSPLKELDDGEPCTQNTDCLHEFCVDGVCCENDCGGTCKACSNAKTGAPNGVCVDMKAGDDFEDECPGSDTCAEGVCRCQNGAIDMGETGADCGGACVPCPGVWSCGAGAGCGAVKDECCIVDCLSCPGNVSECDALHGSPCLVHVDGPKSFSSGVKSNSSCLFTDLSCPRVTCVCELPPP